MANAPFLVIRGILLTFISHYTHDAIFIIYSTGMQLPHVLRLPHSRPVFTCSIDCFLNQIHAASELGSRRRSAALQPPLEMHRLTTVLVGPPFVLHAIAYVHTAFRFDFRAADGGARTKDPRVMQFVNSQQTFIGRSAFSSYAYILSELALVSLNYTRETTGNFLLRSWPGMLYNTGIVAFSGRQQLIDNLTWG